MSGSSVAIAQADAKFIKMADVVALFALHHSLLDLQTFLNSHRPNIRQATDTEIQNILSNFMGFVSQIGHAGLGERLELHKWESIMRIKERQDGKPLRRLDMMSREAREIILSVMTLAYRYSCDALQFCPSHTLLEDVLRPFGLGWLPHVANVALGLPSSLKLLENPFGGDYHLVTILRVKASSFSNCPRLVDCVVASFGMPVVGIEHVSRTENLKSLMLVVPLVRDELQLRTLKGSINTLVAKYGPVSEFPIIDDRTSFYIDSVPMDIRLLGTPLVDAVNRIQSSGDKILEATRKLDDAWSRLHRPPAMLVDGDGDVINGLEEIPCASGDIFVILTLRLASTCDLESQQVHEDGIKFVRQRLGRMYHVLPVLAFITKANFAHAQDLGIYVELDQKDYLVSEFVAVVEKDRRITLGRHSTCRAQRVRSRPKMLYSGCRKRQLECVSMDDEPALKRGRYE